MFAQGAPTIAASFFRDLTWRPIGPIGTSAIASSVDGPVTIIFASVRTDTAFPYRVCGGQSDAGAVCLASRGGPGQGLVRDWEPLGLAGVVAPDPSDPDVIYGALPADASVASIGERGRRRTCRRRAARDFAPDPVRQFCSRQAIREPCTSRPDTLWRTANGGVELGGDQPRDSRAIAA